MNCPKCETELESNNFESYELVDEDDMVAVRIICEGCNSVFTATVRIEDFSITMRST